MRGRAQLPRRKRLPPVGDADAAPARSFLQDEPTATWAGDEEHTLIMIDVDAPEREGDGSVPGKRGPWLHWMVSNAKGGTAGGRTVTDYMAPSPAIGVHRLIFILYKGAVAEKKIEDRITWDVPAFMNTHPNLVPVAFNFMCVAPRACRARCCVADAPASALQVRHVRLGATDGALCHQGVRVCCDGREGLCKEREGARARKKPLRRS